MRVVFMGTPDFAVASLKKIIEEGYTVCGVVTAPDKPAGRGLVRQQSAVKKYSIEKNIPVLQPEKLRDPLFLEQLKVLYADVFVVVAFRMLPDVVWKMPPKGTFNLHASILPQYRGAAPINHAIINGEKETGVTTFFINENIDTGPILFTEKTPIGENENAGSLHDRLKELGANLVCKTLHAIETGNCPAFAQEINPGETLKTAPKLTRDSCRIDWNNDSKTIHNLIRGLSPLPGAWTHLIHENNTSHLVKIFESQLSDTVINQPPGTITTDGKKHIWVSAKNSSIEILSLQLEGKKRITAEEFLNGYKNTGKWIFK